MTEQSYDDILKNANPELRKKIYTWKYRYGESDAIRRFNELIAFQKENDNYLTTISELDSTIQHQYAKYFKTHWILPQIVIITTYIVIYSLTSEAMNEIIQKIISQSSNALSNVGYFIAFIFDIAILMFTSAAFEKRLKTIKRVFSTMSALLLITCTCLSTYVTLEGKNEVKVLEFENHELEKFNLQINHKKNDVQEAKSLYYQIVYPKNWSHCLKILDSQCKLSGYRTIEAHNAKSSWESAKKDLNDAIAKLDSLESTKFHDQDTISITKLSNARSELFVIFLWLVVISAKWYQKSISPILAKREYIDC